MCGRYTLRTTPAELAAIFDLLREPDWSPRWNVAPTQTVPGIRETGHGRELTLFHWGLVPGWSKDPKSGPPLINARGETVAEKPSFRTPFKQRRCLIPADGFYEWPKSATRSKQPRQPYHVRFRDGRPFAFAGLWDRWQPPDPAAPPLESCTIVTTDPNALLATIHDRMPAILPPSAWDEWLDPQFQDVPSLKALLVPYPPDEMELIAVSTLVNNARHDAPDCVVPSA